MLCHDPVYGQVEIDEPVLLDLLQSAAMQRLHGVLQHGVTGLIGVTKPTTRFGHSVGAMLLVRRLGASVEEQVAALLHDISHTAFSHVIDHVFGGHDKQSYHELHKERYVAGTDVPAILARHGYAWRKIAHEENYTLLEQPAPALCADRLDYFFRDTLESGLSTAAQVEFALDHLIVRAGRIGVDDLAAAHWLGHTFMAADQASWGNFREVGLYEVAARAIRTALAIGVISEADLWGTDRQVWAKLQAGDNPTLKQQLEWVSPETKFVRDEAAPTFWVKPKLRTIDPDVWVAGAWQPLSALDSEFARKRAEYLRQPAWPMRVCWDSE